MRLDCLHLAVLVEVEVCVLMGCGPPCGVLAYAPLTPCLSQACFPPALNVSSLSDVSSGAHALLDESKLGCEVEALLRP